MQETWKPVAGYEDSYEVSNLGAVRSFTRKVVSCRGFERTAKSKLMTQRTSHNGYLRVGLNQDGKQTLFPVHRLVAIAFVENPDPGSKVFVNHINGNKQDNRAENLEWVTHDENVAHAIQTGLFDPVGENNAAAKVSEDAVREIRSLFEHGLSCPEISSRLGIHWGTVSLITRGITWKSVDPGWSEAARKQVASGVRRKGSRNGASKLTEAKVREIQRLLDQGVIQAEIGRRLSISRAVICNIAKGNAWTHVNPEWSANAKVNPPRSNRGQKLCPDKVREIKRLLESGLTQLQVSERYGVHHSVIGGIHTGRLWRHIS